MGRIKDLTGQKFYKLTVLEDSGLRNSSRHVIWKCQCDCGKFCFVDGVDLQRGKHKSCGCLMDEARKKNLADYRLINNSPNKIDYTNYKSGRLTAIEPTDKRTSGGNVIWKCQCECGNFIEVSTSELKTKNIQSCGCLRSRSIGEFNIAKLLDANNIKYKQQYRFNDCRSTKDSYLYFDFAILDSNNTVLWLIEFDGPQHQKPVRLFGGEKILKWIQENDNIKNTYAEEHNIPLIRISYDKRDSIVIEDLIPLKEGKPYETV